MWSSMSVDLGMERAALVEVGRVKTVHRMCGGGLARSPHLTEHVVLGFAGDNGELGPPVDIDVRCWTKEIKNLVIM